MKAFNFIKSTGKFLGFGALIGVFVLIFGIYWQLGHGESADYDQVKEAIVQYGNDMNEMREYLYLPQNNYDFFQASLTNASTEGLAPQEDTQYQTGVMMFAEELGKKQSLIKNQEEAKAALIKLTKDLDFMKGLRELKLSTAKEIEVDEEYARLKLLNGKEPLAQLIFDLKTKEYALQSIVGLQTLKGKASSEAVLDFLSENKAIIIEKKELIEGQKNDMKAFFEGRELSQILTQNTLAINADPVETPAAFEYYVTDLNGSPLLTVALDRETGRFVMDAVGYSSITSLKEPFLAKLESLNGETEQIKAIKTKKKNLQNYLVSQEFLAEIKKANLQLSEGVEEGTTLIYELTFGDGQEKLGSIIFDNASGNLTFMDATNGLESSLEDILSGSKKKP